MTEIQVLLDGLIDETLVEDIEQHMDESIASLGVDSLEVMQIVLRIEDILNIEIDYDEFDIASLETPNKIVELLGQYKER